MPDDSSCPWWKDPAPLLFGFFILLACAAILAKGWIAPPTPVDPTSASTAPRGGSFCDPPVPVKSTVERPKPSSN